jgi:hypothetical protein
MKILEAKYAGELKLELLFNNGERLEADLQPYLEVARNPMTAQFTDQQKFAAFSLQNGYITWYGEMDLSADWLYDYARQHQLQHG